jgi:hypothetical protein
MNTPHKNPKPKKPTNYLWRRIGLNKPLVTKWKAASGTAAKQLSQFTERHWFFYCTTAKMTAHSSESTATRNKKAQQKQAPIQTPQPYRAEKELRTSTKGSLPEDSKEVD